MRPAVRAYDDHALSTWLDGPEYPAEYRRALRRSSRSLLRAVSPPPSQLTRSCEWRSSPQLLEQQSERWAAAASLPVRPTPGSPSFDLYQPPFTKSSKQPSVGLTVSSLSSDKVVASARAEESMARGDAARARLMAEETAAHLGSAVALVVALARLVAPSSVAVARKILDDASERHEENNWHHIPAAKLFAGSLADAIAEISEVEQSSLEAESRASIKMEEEATADSAATKNAAISDVASAAAAAAAASEPAPAPASAPSPAVSSRSFRSALAEAVGAASLRERAQNSPPLSAVLDASSSTRPATLSSVAASSFASSSALSLLLRRAEEASADAALAASRSLTLPRSPAVQSYVG